MQLVPKYLLNNSVSLIANLAGEVTEYRPVYQRNMTVYRGIDNVLTFEIKNPDQKPVSILNTYTPKFVMFDENNKKIVERDGTIKETSTPLYKGQFTVTVTENDLLNVKEQFCSYNVFSNISGNICSRSINLCIIFSRESTSTMWSSTTISIYNNLSAR